LFFPNNDEIVKSQIATVSVIPAKAGIQLFQNVLDPGFRRGDDWRVFLRDHQIIKDEVFARATFAGVRAFPSLRVAVHFAADREAGDITSKKWRYHQFLSSSSAL